MAKNSTCHTHLVTGKRKSGKSQTFPSQTFNQSEHDFISKPMQIVGSSHQMPTLQVAVSSSSTEFYLRPSIAPYSAQQIRALRTSPIPERPGPHPNNYSDRQSNPGNQSHHRAHHSRATPEVTGTAPITVRQHLRSPSTTNSPRWSCRPQRMK